jgi:predicted nucleotide-binding protein (sugar kinase/HSP70/actin superfamily)
MMLTLGTLLNELGRDDNPADKYAFFMPTAHGPCRFGVYHGLHKIALERAGYGDRVSLISPDDADYFAGMSADFSARLWLGFVVHDLLQAMLLDVRPAERSPGAANAVWERSLERLCGLLETPVKGSTGSTWAGIRQLAGGMWGLRALLTEAADAFARIPRRSEQIPSVAVVGEIYVRLDPFANDFIVDKLEARGLRARFAPFIEWLEYSNAIAVKRLIAGNRFTTDEPLAIGVSALVQNITSKVLYRICAQRLDWPARTTISDTLRAARPYIHPALVGEAALSLGGPLHEFRHGHIEGVVMVGPHECMPCKIAEAQFGTASEHTNVPYLAIDVNGDPIDTELLDRFAYDIHHAHERPSAAQKRRVSLPMIGDAHDGQRARLPSWRAGDPS